jgi:predicted TIM-barrel fold metal-dependent hydrolase
MNPLTNRRAFLQQTALLAAGTSSGILQAAVQANDKTFPIIDTHQQLWDLTKFRLPWLKTQLKLNKSFLMADYLQVNAELARAAAKTGSIPAKVVKTVYMEVDVAPEQQQAEAEHIIAICKRGDTPMVAAVISGRPASEGFVKYIKPFKDSPYIKGVRQVLHGPGTPAGYCLDRPFIQSIRLLGELGMSFDLCMRPAELPDAGKLIDACPDTRFILDHCGNANVQAKDRTQWQRDMADLARRKNLACKVSGIVASAKPDAWTVDDLAPIVNHTLAVFGPDRVIFAVDWPVCTLAASLAQWVEALRTIVRDRKNEEQRKLFHDNAIRVYRLG